MSHCQWRRYKSFITLTLWTNAIKHYSSKLMNRLNKLECLFQACLSYLVMCLRIKSGLTHKYQTRQRANTPAHFVTLSVTKKPKFHDIDTLDQCYKTLFFKTYECAKGKGNLQKAKKPIHKFWRIMFYSIGPKCQCYEIFVSSSQTFGKIS